MTLLMPSLWPGIGFLAMQVLFTIAHMASLFSLSPSVLHFQLGTSPLSYYTESVKQSINPHIHVTYFTWTVLSPILYLHANSMWCLWPLTPCLPLSVTFLISQVSVWCEMALYGRDIVLSVTA